jgi:hypothetical protein
MGELERIVDHMMTGRDSELVLATEVEGLRLFRTSKRLPGNRILVYHL